MSSVKKIKMNNQQQRKQENSSKHYGSANTLFYCRGCDKPCRSKGVLQSHEKCCSNLKMGSLDSFFKINPLEAPTSSENTRDKILPMSQPLLTSPGNEHTENQQQSIPPEAPDQDAEQEVQMEEMMTSSEDDNRPEASDQDAGQQEVQVEERRASTEDENCPICRVDVTEEV